VRIIANACNISAKTASLGDSLYIFFSSSAEIGFMLFKRFNFGLFIVLGLGSLYKLIVHKLVGLEFFQHMFFFALF